MINQHGELLKTFQANASKISEIARSNADNIERESKYRDEMMQKIQYEVENQKRSLDNYRQFLQDAFMKSEQKTSFAETVMQNAVVSINEFQNQLSESLVCFSERLVAN